MVTATILVHCPFCAAGWFSCSVSKGESLRCPLIFFSSARLKEPCVSCDEVGKRRHDMLSSEATCVCVCASHYLTIINYARTFPARTRSPRYSIADHYFVIIVNIRLSSCSYNTGSRVQATCYYTLFGYRDKNSASSDGRIAGHPLVWVFIDGYTFLPDWRVHKARQTTKIMPGQMVPPKRGI